MQFTLYRPAASFPGARIASEPGISRFRARCFASPRNGAQSKKAPTGLFAFSSPSSATLVRVGPDLLLGEVHQAGKDDQEDEDLHAQPLAFLHVRLGRPHQEGRDVMGILLDGRGRAVIEGDLAV